MFQPNMLKVLYALIPCAGAGVYLFGWRVLAILAVSLLTGFFVEAAFTWPSGKPVTMAVFVTAVLLSLSLPPGLPIWMAAVGTAFAIVFGKMAFGGMGGNIFNPALVGRCFLYLAFPSFMTTGWTGPAAGTAGFTSWAVDTVSGATPLDAYKAGEAAGLLDMFLGNINGSIGETSTLIIILAGIYLIWTKSAAWQTMLACIFGLAAASGILHFTDPDSVAGPLYYLCAGGFMFGAVFMATDPVSSARTPEGKWIYGIGIGILIAVLRGYSNFSCGVMYSILMFNMFAPLIDVGVKNFKAARKNKKSSSAAPEKA